MQTILYLRLLLIKLIPKFVLLFNEMNVCSTQSLRQVNSCSIKMFYQTLYPLRRMNSFDHDDLEFIFLIQNLLQLQTVRFYHNQASSACSLTLNRCMMLRTVLPQEREKTYKCCVMVTEIAKGVIYDQGMKMDNCRQNRPREFRMCY